MSDTFNFTDGTSGNIYKTLGYTTYTGWVECKIFYSPLSGAERQAFLQYATSSIPDSATVTLTEHKLIEGLSQPRNQTNAGRIYMGTFIGSTLGDNPATEWVAGTDVYTGSWNLGSWTTLDSKANDLVSLTAETDFRLQGTYSGIVTEGKNFNQEKSKSQLRVTYTLPTGSRLPLLGVGCKFLGIISGLATYQQVFTAK